MSRRRSPYRPRMTRERGAAAVEFAIIAPLLFMIVLGMFSGGFAFARKIAITDATREAVRYGATLPLDSTGVTDAWLDAVAKRAIDSAGIELAETWEGQHTCVAYVGLSPGGAGPITRSRTKNGTGAASYASTWCFDDGRGSTERRVQVVAGRDSLFQAVLFSHNINIESEGVARYEAVAP